MRRCRKICRVRVLWLVMEAKESVPLRIIEKSTIFHALFLLGYFLPLKMGEIVCSETSVKN